MDKYYEKATKQIGNKEVEEALTTFVSGLEHGYVKCAFGIVHTVTNLGSRTISDDEAIDIFEKTYSEIKLLAQEGDTEAMVMVAEGIRYGFVEDDDEPYMFWLEKASSLGDERAIAILQEIEGLENPLGLQAAHPTIPNEVIDSMDSTDVLLLDDRLDMEFVEDAEVIDIPEEHVLIGDVDEVILDDLGLVEHAESKIKRNELLRCRDDQVID